ncbi:MAG: hypothetical protein E6Q76_19700 [Rhizobium sp.]|nr:MAG: hypothetical protein E6Q76_19700 [Rhizobium sp.]
MPLLEEIIALWQRGECYRTAAAALSDLKREAGDGFTADLWHEVAEGRQWIDRVTDAEVVVTSGWQRSEAAPLTSRGRLAALPGHVTITSSRRSTSP